MRVLLIALLVLLCGACKDKKQEEPEELPAWLFEEKPEPGGKGHPAKDPEPPVPAKPGDTQLVAKVDDPGSLVIAQRGATYIVVWSTFWEGSIRARSYAMDGTPIGEPLTLVTPRNCPTASGDPKPCAIVGVALDVAEDGSLVLAWSEENGKLDRGKICVKCWPLDTRVQLFTRDLDPATRPRTIDEPVIEEANTGGGLTDKAVVFAPDGSFMVAWIRDVKNVPGQIVTRVFTSGGAPLGDPPRDPAAEDAGERCPSLEPMGEGSVLTWSARDGAWAQLLDGTFQKQGEPLRLSEEARCPRIAGAGDVLHVLLGEDPATWQGFTSEGARGEPTSVMFLYPPAIAAFLSDNPDLSVATSLYVLDAAPGQGPVVVWAAHTGDRKHHLGIHGQRYASSGETLGEPLVLDEAILKWKTVDAIDIHVAQNGFAVVWRQKKKIHIKVFASDGSG
jgi:hypothetical protein